METVVTFILVIWMTVETHRKEDMIFSYLATNLLVIRKLDLHRLRYGKVLLDHDAQNDSSSVRWC